MSDNGEWQQIAQLDDAIVYKVSTLAAGGFRITIDGISPEIAQAAFLMPFADTPGATLRVTFERWKPSKTLTELDDATKEGTEGKATSLDSRRTRKRRDQLSGS